MSFQNIPFSARSLGSLIQISLIICCLSSMPITSCFEHEEQGQERNGQLFGQVTPTFDISLCYLRITWIRYPVNRTIKKEANLD